MSLVVILRRLEQFWSILEKTMRESILSRLPSLLPAELDCAERYLLSSLRSDGLPELPISELYLKNLKTAVHWIVKLTQVDALTEEALAHPEHAFHTAMHLSNLLSVSEHLPVRERAGASLVRLGSVLPLDQMNEIIVDLLRELETGQDEISAFIPNYLGVLIAKLPDKELSECLEYLRNLIRASTVRTATASLLTLSRIMPELPDSESARADEILGILLAGVSHYNETIHETALTVLCEHVLAAPALSEYDTMIVDDGENLSQGQRQLLAIARAAVADPPVLILDEATSSIDTRTESLIEKGMDELMANRTVFVIAHRLSTVRNSNAIMVLEHGRIIERGDHAALIAQKGRYYQLYTGAFELS